MGKKFKSVALSETASSGVIALLLAGAAAAVAATPAQAQSPAPAAQETDRAGMGDIVVTATRQSQTAQSVPISLTAVGADQLAKEGVTGASQLGQLAPSLYVLSSVSEGSPRVSIRGLTGTDYLSAGSPTVATYVDDVYQAFQFGITSSLFDLQRIEILRGPQGTTFGRNTTAGAVAYFAQTPTNEMEGYVTGRLAGGDQSQRFLEAAINVPISESLAMRASGRFDSKGNWVRDLANDRGRGAGDGQSARLQLRWTPSSDTTANLTVFGTRWRGDSPVGNSVPAGMRGNPKIVSHSPYDLHDNFDNNGATLRIEHDFGLFDLTSISHYRKSKFDTAQDNDGRPEDLFLYQSKVDAEQYGQEVRLASDPTLRVSGIMGLYYEHDRVDDVNNEASTLNGPPFDFNNLARNITTTKSYAAFGNLTVKLTDSLSVIGGLRKTIEKRKINISKLYFNTADFSSGTFDWTQGNIRFNGAPPAAALADLNLSLSHPDRIKSKPLTWDATVNFNPDKSLLVFARAAKGYRSGGFNPAPTSVLPQSDLDVVLAPFAGESVRSYEAGIKSTLLDNMLRINAGVYHYDFSNQQITEYLLVGTLPVAYTTNAGKSKVDGGEIEIALTPDDHWQLRSSLSYTNARYKRYVAPALGIDFSGNKIVQAPKWTANASVGYVTPVSDSMNVRATTVWTYRSKIFFDSANSADFADGARAKGSIRIGLEPNEGKGFSVTAFVDNLTNQRPLASGFPYGDGTNLMFYEPGRSFGVDVSYRW